jgi:hypothetical protein
MMRQTKISIGKMRDSGPTRLLIFCGDFRCAHSVVISADSWSGHSGYPIFNGCLSARLAATVAPMSGRNRQRIIR